MEYRQERKRVILYARVSTKQQVREGFSLNQQIERLREYAAEQGYEVVEECIDGGHSGTVLERPGLERVRDLVEAGGISVVLAQDADRITRNPYHRGWLDDEFAKHGTRLIALDDWGDDSHEGQLLKFVKGWQAKGEAAKIAERSERNKRKKAREGKVVGGHPASYGYGWARDENGKVVSYAVDEAAMNVVRRIFADAATGESLNSIKVALDRERDPTPGNGSGWSRSSIRNLILKDLYKPHSIEELRGFGVSETVLTTLDGDKFYGVYRFEGIPVPVPDAGIPPEVVESARYRVRNNKAPSKNGDRFWELSGGILFCEVCGNRMQTHTGRRRDKTYPYYRCTRKSDSSVCGSYINAGEIEAEVWEGVRRLLDDKEYTLGKMRESFDAKRRELSGPGLDAGVLARRLKGIEARWVKYQKAYEADAISVADLAARRTELEGERERIERELERMSNGEAELEHLEAEQSQIEARIREGWGDLDDGSPETRREVYEDLRLRVEVGKDKRPLLSGWFPIGGGIKAYAEGPKPRRLFNAEWPPRHRVSSVEMSPRHVGSLTGPIDPLTRIVGSGACPERAA